MKSHELILIFEEFLVSRFNWIGNDPLLVHGKYIEVNLFFLGGGHAHDFRWIS